MSPTVYLISGAGRGIGFTMVEQLAAKSDTVVYAGVRTFPPSADSPLAQLAAKSPKTVIPIKLTSGDASDNQAAAEEIKAKYGKVDVLIANAGVSSGLSPSISVTADQLRSDFETNTIGPVILYQSFHKLLLAASGAKFIVISSALGQITDALEFPMSAYGASKAAVNFLVKKIHQEAPEITAFPMHPGLVSTDMGRKAAAPGGPTLEEMGAISPEQSAKGILAVIEKATRETHSGKFWNVTGEQMTY